MVTVQGDSDLLEIVDALHPPRGFTSRLDRREKQRDQHGDDRDHDRKLDQGNAATLLQERALQDKHRLRGSIGSFKQNPRLAEWMSHLIAMPILV